VKILNRNKNGGRAIRLAAGVSGGTPVLFPGPDGWELWSGSSQHPVCTGPADKPLKLRPGAGCLMSLPTRSFFSMPLWVPVVEDSPAREQTQIRLEMRGMLGANPEAAIWNCEAIRRDQLPPTPEGEAVIRQLEATAILASPFQEEWLVEEAARYEPAGRLLPAPGPGAAGVLRRELGRWVADFYQGGKWLHSQPLLSPALDGAAAVELNATLAQLEGEAILSRLDGWWIREGSGVAGEDLVRQLSVPLHPVARSAPQLHGEAWNLPPPLLTERRAERTRAAQRHKMIRTALTAYAVLGFLAVGFLLWPLVRLKLARAELEKIGPEAESIRTTAVLWREAAAWLEPRRNALELLWQVSRPLIETEPPKVEGVRITLFDLNPKRLLLQGEGKDLEKVEKYFQWLKGDSGLAGFTWKNPQPRLLPNGNAQFQAEGIPPGVVPTEEGGENESPDGS